MIIIRKIPVVAMLNVEKPSVKADENSIMGNMQAIKDKSFFKFKIKIEYRRSIIKVACFLEKILRKLRLNVLKLDNFFNKWITILRENTKNNSENLSIEKTRLFEHNMQKFKEVAQKLPGQAYRIIEDGVEKSLVFIAPDNRVSKKSAIKDFFENNGKVKDQEISRSTPIIRAPQVSKSPQNASNFKSAKTVQTVQTIHTVQTVQTVQTIQTVQQDKVFEDESVYIEKIAKNPRDTEAYRMLGRLYVSQKNYSDASASFMEIIKIKKSDFEAENMILKIKKMM